MTIKEYLLNPMGPGNSSLMLSVTRNALDEEYRVLCSKMSVTWYSLGDKLLIAHIKVPSKKINDLYYDVLIEINVDSIPSGVTTINDAQIRVFSNCPSFIFTYAKVFFNKGILIDWARRKYDMKIFTDDPIKRNPSKIVNYEKSLYFAFKFIISNGRNYKDKIKLHNIKAKTNTIILDKIKSSDKVLDEYNYKSKKMREKNIRINKSIDDSKSKQKKTNGSKNTIVNSKSTRKIKHAKKIKKIK